MPLLPAIWILCAACLLCNGCSYAPPNTETRSVAYVDNHQDAGLVRPVRNAAGAVTGYVVRDGYIVIYHWLVNAQHDGLKLKPPLLTPTGVQADGPGFWIVDSEHVADVARMVQIEKKAQTK